MVRGGTPWAAPPTAAKEKGRRIFRSGGLSCFVGRADIIGQV